MNWKGVAFVSLVVGAVSGIAFISSKHASGSNPNTTAKGSPNVDRQGDNSNRPIDDPQFRASSELSHDEEDASEKLAATLEDHSSTDQFKLLLSYIQANRESHPNRACAAAGLLIERFPTNSAAIDAALQSLRSWYSTESSSSPYPSASVSYLEGWLAGHPESWDKLFDLLQTFDTTNAKIVKRIFPSAASKQFTEFFQFMFKRIEKGNVDVKNFDPVFVNPSFLGLALSAVKSQGEPDQLFLLGWLSGSASVRQTANQLPSAFSSFLNSSNPEIARLARDLAGQKPSR